MLKKILIVFGIVTLLLSLGCAQQPPTPEPTPTPKAPATVEEIEEVGTGISDITTVDEELDASELDDLDAILEDIENI